MQYHIRTLAQLRPILVSLRKQAGLSQVAMASLLGVSQQSYAKIEANPSATSLERLFKILGLLGADIILGKRMSIAAPNESKPHEHEGVTTTSPRQENSLPVKKSGRKSPRPAPPKLLPPSDKKEDW